MRAVFYDEDDAIAVAARLRRDGWDVALVRERFAGEDDDEDHPWALVTDAPEVMLELLVEEHDGWLDTDPAGQGPPLPGVPPLDLPDGPRRHFRER
jgi:hypothetical protein